MAPCCYYRIAALVVLLAVLGLSCHGQQLHMIHVPNYVVLQPQSPDSSVSSSDIHNILSGSLGLNNHQTPFIQSKSVLRKPKANVLFTIVTHKEMNLPVNSMASIHVNWDVPFVETEQLMSNLQNKFLSKDPVMLEVSSSNQFFDVKTSSLLFQSLPSSFDSFHNRFLDAGTSFLNRLTPLPRNMSLNSSLSSDGNLLAEMQMVDDVISTLKSKVEHLDTKVPDLLFFTLTGLRGVSDEHGINSQQSRDAQDIIIKHFNQITEELKSLYKGNVMIEILTVPHVDVAKVRKTRSLMQTESTSSPTHAQLNLELDWYSDFPVIFNIVLWLMVVLVITVLFVAYGIWNLNPNLDSILYRVPQDDLKKNN